ncbi:hypothetical protein PROFUN_06338 [Planoprotostelium fungivorum]|uniref:protein-tyrosine-phosphatase n=1 Tax=Planoprotostelium fungivorum TaxID=1890364 RepID=A0A2P6NP66_9EUKA|nr:hypothetical protein PROFUN_06338 [Planoprotostelium fungivorum]
MQGHCITCSVLVVSIAILLAGINFHPTIEDTSKQGSREFHSNEMKLISDLRRKLNSDAPEREFQNIERLYRTDNAIRLGTTEEALREENLAKNRYTDVIPYDHSRVKLQSNDSEEVSDYINASFIQGEDNHYIAAQGPLPETSADFWKMIWDEDVNVLVMLTKINENGRVKCHRYYPEKLDGDNVFQFGDLRVQLLSQSEDQHASTVTRTYLLTHTITDEERTVTHYQYLGWPDHGVPKSTKGIRGLIDTMESHVTESGTNGPILVHCSAGIGRTGAFITIHVHIQRMKKYVTSGAQFDSNIYNTVKRLRQQRAGMVQQPEQYRFCYEAILEGLKELVETSSDKHPSQVV